MATEVYIVRHGEAEGNLYRRAQGHSNGNLTEMGLRQVELLRKRFKGIHLDAAYSSDLTRAYMTGRAVCDERGIEVQQDKNFREMYLGVWENRPWGEIIRNYKDDYKNFDRHPYEWRTENAETYEQAGKRFYDEMMKKAHEHDGQTIAIFAHGSVIRAMLMLVYSLNPDSLPKEIGHCDNTAITHMYIDGDKITVDYLYDSEHLGETSTFLRHLPEMEKRNFKVNLWFRPLEAEDEEFYKECRREAWQLVYGSLDGYDEEGCWFDVCRVSKNDPDSVAISLLEDERVGIIQLDPERYVKKGHIVFYYMIPKYRGISLGVQLMGYAATYYRERGRQSLTLRVSDNNTKARGFYEYYGFKPIAHEDGAFGAGLTMMEKDIRQNTLRG